MKEPQVKFKNLGKDTYGESDNKTRTITINPKKNRSGVEFLDTMTHEKNHLANWKASEGDIINKTEKQVKSLIAII